MKRCVLAVAPVEAFGKIADARNELRSFESRVLVILAGSHDGIIM